MASSSQKGKYFMRPTKSVGVDFDDKPLWNHVKVVSIAPNGGGNRTWSCNYCNKKVMGSYNRVKAHLLRLSGHGVQICKESSGDIYATLKMEHEQAERKRTVVQVDARNKADYISLPEGTDLIQQKKRKSSSSGAIGKSFGIYERNTADKLAARMFYASVENSIPGYIPPSYNRLRTTLLAQEKTHIDRKLQPIKGTWKKKGLSICSDGWSDTKRRPLINIMASSSGGPMFLNSINSSGIVGETRFASHIIMTTRIRKVKSSLEKMVMDDEWKNYKGDKGIEAKTREIKSLIMNDEKWDSIDYFLKFTEPIVDMLRSADIDGPKLHLIYDMWDSMIEKVKKVIFEHEGKDLISGQSNFFDTIHDILVARWNKSNTPLHCMAHSLVPKYYHESWLQGENGIRKLAPNEDSEISLNRVKCFQRYFKDSNEMKQVSLEYGSFCSGSGYFSEPHVIEAMMYEDSLSWWANHGVSAPLLQQLAYKLLTQPASSSCCERNWSGDRFDIDETTNDLTELSIDEPQIEGVIFEEEFEDLEEVEEDVEDVEEIANLIK
ncbi:hypothetical protein KY284_011026 [Solanum tuberosum]|nr:hypothetical protein KY284_011026 [Solanum tuberosum]